MRIAFYGGQTAGVITLLTLLASKHDIRNVIYVDEGIKQIANSFQLRTFPPSILDDPAFPKEIAANIDLFICCHGRKILSRQFVETLPCINLHPCLYRYKGVNPIKRLIADGNPKASVASHWMVEKIDAGEILFEEYKMIENIEIKTEAEVYAQLYPLYTEVLVRTLKKIKYDRNH